jgi:hypothetical protein
VTRTKPGGGSVRWGLPAEERIPYQLHRLRKAIKLGLPVYVCEGEKSVDAINHLDIGLRRHTATTMPGGSAQWNTGSDPHRHFTGAAEVIVVVDRDIVVDPGLGTGHEPQLTLGLPWLALRRGDRGPEVVVRFRVKAVRIPMPYVPWRYVMRSPAGSLRMRAYQLSQRFWHGMDGRYGWGGSCK